MAYDPNKMIANTTNDPFQGYDVKVSTQGMSMPGGGSTRAGSLVGAFTSAMVKVINQTETYLALNSKIPRQLDGEIIIVWALEQGLVDPAVMTNTFGAAVAGDLNNGRGVAISRTARFKINFAIELDQTSDPQAAVYYNEYVEADGNSIKVEFSLGNCRVDTYSFGMTAGRHVIANSWQGTAESFEVLSPNNDVTSNGLGVPTV